MSMRDKIRAIPERHRSKFDASKMITVDSEIRTKAVAMTMDLLRNISDVSEPQSYVNVSRNMMMIANSTPIKCVCMGISPYETDILPTFASALAYDPKKCLGSTPSVQALSQMMSLCALSIKKMDMKKIKSSNTDAVLSQDEYTAKFAMMLRCSYACMSAGVVFVNAAPTVTSNIAKRLRVASMLSEWLGRMASLHVEFDRKFMIISMGALAEMCTNDILKSYPKLRKGVRLYTMVNPAIIQHMNVNRTETPDPIDRRPTYGELKLDVLMDVRLLISINSSFQWYKYGNDVLISLMSRNKKGIATDTRGDARGAVAALASLLVDEVPEDLVSRFTYMVERLNSTTGIPTNSITSRTSYANIPTRTNENTSMDSAMDFITSMPLVDDPNNIAQSDVDPSDEVRDETAFNPFVMAQMNSSGSGVPSMNASQQQGSEQNRDIESYKGQHMVSRRSTIAQLTDPSGKSVSQHVIVLDSMIRSLNDSLSTTKQMHEDMKQIAERQAQVYSSMVKKGAMSEEDMEKAVTFIESFEEFCKRMMKDLEDQYGIVAALPDVVEGDRGIYEHETHPSAPMMRSIDGRTMKEFVYGEMLDSSRRNAPAQPAPGPAHPHHHPQQQRQAQAHAQQPAPQQAHVREVVNSSGGFNPFLAQMGTSASSATNTDLTTAGDKSMEEKAQSYVESIAETVSNIDEEWAKKACDNLLEVEIDTASGSMPLIAVISVLVAEYMSINSGTPPKKSVMKEMFTTLGDDDDFPEFKSMLSTWIKNTSSAMEMFEMLDE